MNPNLVRFCIPMALAFVAIMCLLAGWIDDDRGYLKASVGLSVASAVAFVLICLGSALAALHERPMPPLGRHGASRHSRGFPPGTVPDDAPPDDAHDDTQP